MKVLSLIEPWATLIKEGKKVIETRSWKTYYRGELYIHASSKKIKKAAIGASDSNQNINFATEKHNRVEKYEKIHCSHSIGNIFDNAIKPLCRWRT